jgi:hypothetical protein
MSITGTKASDCVSNVHLGQMQVISITGTKASGLFIISLEILANAIQRDKNIKGISIGMMKLNWVNLQMTQPVYWMVKILASTYFNFSFISGLKR